MRRLGDMPRVHEDRARAVRSDQRIDQRMGFGVRKFVVLVTILAMLVSVIVALQWFRWRDAKRVADLTATVQSPPPLASPVPGMVGAGFSPRGFAAYVKLQKFDWRPAFIVVHHTVTPTLAQWKRMSGEQRVDQMAKVFKERGWSGGPHLFIDDEQIWVLNPVTKPGVHAGTWNQISIGVEIVGDYATEPFDGFVRVNTVSAIATLSDALGLDPRTLRFHSELPGTRKAACPGANVRQDYLIRLVQLDLARRRLEA